MRNTGLLAALGRIGQLSIAVAVLPAAFAQSPPMATEAEFQRAYRKY